MLSLRKIAATAALAAALFVPAVAGAQTKASPDEAKSVAEKAAALVRDKGLDEARKAFYAEGEFKHDDLYVCVIDKTGTWLVYPPKPEGEGKNVSEVKDADGVFIVKEILKVASEKGAGTVEYRWLNPTTKKIDPKITFVNAVPERGVVVYAGAYKN